jgi:subtilisin family serine protease
VVPDDTTLVYLDIWYPGNAELGVAVAEPAACATGIASLGGAGVVTASTPCGNIVITAGDTNPANGDRRSFVSLTSGTQLPTGIWSLSITGETLPATGATRFDIWSDAQPAGNAPTFNTLGSAQTTIISPASAAEAISVVPYVSKVAWVSLIANCCQLPPERGTIQNLATYASQGPLRPCTTCGTLAQKPDLAAPGLMVTSSFSSRIPDDPALDAQVDPDRRHYALEGSSMAAPHVAGAAALLLQVNPALTAREVKTYLLNNVLAPQSPPPHPIERWGQGRVNVQAAIAAMKAAGDDPPPTAPAGLRVTSVRSQRVVLAWDATPDLDLRSYQVLRRAESDPVAALVRELPPTQTTVEDTDPLLANETAYVYTVQAIDMSGLSSGESAEVRAVPTAGEGSVGLCFIATAAYGSPWHPHVASLRTFRDRFLRPHALGRAVIAAYETISPPLARTIAPRPTLRAVTRVALTPVVLAIEHPREAAVLLGLGLLGILGLGLLRRSP